MNLTVEEFRLFRNLIYEESGMYLKESRKDFLENRVARRMTETKMTSPYWYYKHVTENRKTEMLVLLDLLTVNETSFFRNGPQIELFRNLTLPDLIRKKEASGNRSLRIWSAGCSTGEEPYTIGMAVREAIPMIGQWNVKIFASDLSLTVLQAASRAEYNAEKVHATVEDYYIVRYFEKHGTVMKVRDEIKRMVVFDFHNLKNDNGLRDLDVIFCRNVMIYFDEEEQKRVVNRFYGSLTPGGYLFIGHAESLQGMNTGFQFIYDKKGTAYLKPE